MKTSTTKWLWQESKNLLSKMPEGFLRGIQKCHRHENSIEVETAHSAAGRVRVEGFSFEWIGCRDDVEPHTDTSHARWSHFLVLRADALKMGQAKSAAEVANITPEQGHVIANFDTHKIHWITTVWSDVRIKKAGLFAALVFTSQKKLNPSRVQALFRKAHDQIVS